MKIAALLLLTLLATPALAQGTLHIGMTVADIPQTTGQPDQGMEGYRFTGYPAYDALVNWDLSRADIPPKLVPGLATEWHVDPADSRTWVITLRAGVKFHDGAAFDADAVIWNLDKIYNSKSPQYDPRQTSQVIGRTAQIFSYEKRDAMTVAITTKAIDAFFPYEASYLFFSSPAQWERVGRDWAAFALHPSGTGPFRIETVVPRQRLEMARNDSYWDKSRIPRLDRLILLPIPDAVTRSSALLAGQIDWAEAPAPDMLAQLRASGGRIVTNVYPHIWPYEPSRLPGSPWNDIRVRKAINLAIDRDGLTQLLGGTMQPAIGYVTPSSPWFGHPDFHIRYDPEEAKKLLAEAGYTPSHPLQLRVAISTSGSGQMQPLPMNEFIQQNLAAIGVDLHFEVLEWETLRSRRRVGAAAEVNRKIDAINNSYGPIDPATAFPRQFDSANIAPIGFNWGEIKDPLIDQLIHQAQQTFSLTEQDKLLARVHEEVVNQALYVFIAHDLNPRALSSHVKGFVQAESWVQDFSPVFIAP
jgi:ABC-type transport system substrate-binding protein